MKTKHVWLAWCTAICISLGFTGRSNAQDLFEEQALPVHTQGVLKSGAAAGDTRITVAGGFDFNDGTVQGWHTEGPRDEDGHVPFPSHFSASWADAVNHPTASLGETIGNHRGSYKICNVGGHGISNPGARYWVLYWFSPDVSTVTNWQSANGYTIQLLNGMDLIAAEIGEYLNLYVNLHVTVYDHDQARERYFRAFSSDRAIETWNESPRWIELSYDWTGVLSTIPHHTIREVYVSVRGFMEDYFEGGIYLDEIQPVLAGSASPMISLSSTSLDFGRVENTLTIEIANSGGGSLAWSAAESPDVPWITSITPSSGVGAETVTVTVDRSLLAEEEGSTEIHITSNGGDKTVAVLVRKSQATPWIHADIETKLMPGDGAEGDTFGQCVDVDGDYVIVGASGDDHAAGSNAGAAYIYHWDGANWIEQKKLVALDGAEEDYFGYSVGISGDYAIVGSCWDDDAADKSGSAYIFKRSGTTWTQEAKLVAADAGQDNRFGISVAIDGEYALVGAFFDDDFGTRSGSAYIFKRSGSTWAQHSRLLASDGAENDWFGVSTSLDGEYAAVGARYHDTGSNVDAGAVYIFKRDGTTWNEQQKIEAGDATAGDLFHECSIQGDWLAVGAFKSDSKAKDAGAVYLFHREGSSWIERQKLTADDGAEGDLFGARTALNGDCLVVGAYLDDDNGKDSGSLYVFRFDEHGWQQETKIIASDGAEGDWFGLPVNMDGPWIVAGARQQDQNGSNSGSVFIFKYEDKNRWIHEDIESKMMAADGAEKDLFGTYVDKDGDYIIVGAPYEDPAAGADAGAAYIYYWDGTQWMEQQKLLPLDGAAEDYFGYAVGISGDYAIVGSCWDDDAADKSGSAYIFKKTGSNWVQQAKLVANDAGQDNRFGISVAIDGEYALVGAFFDDDFGTRSGSAYIFKRNGTIWTQQARVLASDGAANDWYGVCTALDGDYAAVGSRYHDNGAISDVGAVYVYKRSGAEWNEQQKLVAGDGAAADLFHQCSIAGSWLAIGAYQNDGKAKNAGAVYLFQRDGEVWSERQKIMADDGAEGDFFGAHTSLDENGLIVSAYLDDDNGKDSGSFYVFRYDGSQWQQETKIIASDGAAEDWFSLPVVYEGGWIVAGARQEDDKGDNSGAIYIYRYLSPTTAVEEKELCLPSACRLEQNYPNPFNPQTTIHYQLSDPAEAVLTVYDAMGRTVAVLDQGWQAQGAHAVVWQGLNDRGQPVSSGLYFYRLEVRPAAADDPVFMDLKKMILLK